MADCSETIECRVLREHYSDLCQLIDNASSVASDLYSKGLINREVRDNTARGTRHDANRSLISAVERLVINNPEQFHEFIAVLNRHPYLSFVVGNMKDALQKYKNPMVELQQPEPEPKVPRSFPKILQCPVFQLHLRDIYFKKLSVPDREMCPHLDAMKVVDLACIKKKKMNPRELDKFTKDTIHGNIDDIWNSKEAIMITDIAKVQDEQFQDCILIEGAPGVGKSTFVRMLCRGWAEDKYLSQYSVVLLLSLSDESVRRAKTVDDLFTIVCQSMPLPVGKVVEKVKNCCGSGIAIIFDGFDELPLDLRTENSLISQIIKGNQLRCATKIVTSRHSATSSLRRMNTITQHVEILGFRKSNIKEYIESELSDQRPLLEKFKSYLVNYPYMSSMMYIPLNCAIVVDVYRFCDEADKETIPTTSTELYEALIRALLIRYLCKRREEGVEPNRVSCSILYDYSSICGGIELNDISDLMPPLYQQFIELCKLAYDGLCDNQQLIFKDSELPHDFQHFGIMQRNHELYTGKGVSSFHSFLHLTVQEFLASYFMNKNCVSGKMIENFIKYHNDSHFRQVLIFLAGLAKFQDINPEEVKGIQSLICSPLRDTLKKISLDGIRWLFEAQKVELVGDVVTGHVVFEPSPEHLTLHDCYKLGYCIANSHSTCVWDLDLSDVGLENEQVEMISLGIAHLESNRDKQKGTIVKLILRNNWLTSKCLRHLAQACFLKELVELNISKNKFDSSVCREISCHLLPLMPKCRNICLSLNNIGKKGIIPLFPSLTHLSHLEEIGLYETYIGYEDIKVLCRYLPSMQNLILLDIGKNDLCEESIQLVIDTLLTKPNLLKLAMANNHVTSAHVSSLAEVLRTNHKLKALYLEDCGVENEGACELASALCTPDSGLEVLNLNENYLKEKAGIAFAKALENSTSLLQLQLARNRDLENEAVQMMVDSLKCNKHKKLILPSDYRSCTNVPEALVGIVMWL